MAITVRDANDGDVAALVELKRIVHDRWKNERVHPVRDYGELRRHLLGGV